MAKKPAVKTLRITLVKSAIGYSEKHKDTVKALGLRHLNETVVQVDSPALQGMLRKVNHLVKVEEQEAK
jgi:large subunit ribosomal protein L30